MTIQFHKDYQKRLKELQEEEEKDPKGARHQEIKLMEAMKDQFDDEIDCQMLSLALLNMQRFINESLLELKCQEWDQSFKTSKD